MSPSIRPASSSSRAQAPLGVPERRQRAELGAARRPHVAEPALEVAEGSRRKHRLDPLEGAAFVQLLRRADRCGTSPVDLGPKIPDLKLGERPTALGGLVLLAHEVVALDHELEVAFELGQARLGGGKVGPPRPPYAGRGRICGNRRGGHRRKQHGGNPDGETPG